jgi:hypothetical protein
MELDERDLSEVDSQEDPDFSASQDKVWTNLLLLDSYLLRDAQEHDQEEEEEENISENESDNDSTEETKRISKTQKGTSKAQRTTVGL